MTSKVRRVSMQYAINWLREVAVLQGGAMPGLYNGFVGLMRTSIATLIEAKQQVPVMFNSFEALKSWAQAQKFSIDGVDDLSNNEVLRLRPTTDPNTTLTAVELYWVKANSELYRTAMVRWCHHHYGKSHVLRAHRESISFFQAVRKDLGMLSAKHPVFGRRGRTAILSSIDESIVRQRKALKSGGSERVAYQLLATLDADHVLNRASLKKIPSAWVLLFPVPSDANRGFGRIIERYRKQLLPNTQIAYLDHETAFKLFCGAMPRDKQQLSCLRKVIAGQLQDAEYIDAMCSAIEVKLP